MNLRIWGLSLLLAACAVSTGRAEHNTLTEAEKLSGWKLLFDGKTTDGWRNFKKSGISEGWKVENGELIRADKGAGDIITKEQYESFELFVEFKISSGGNSGLMFHVTEEANTPWQTGPEIQILDNDKGRDPQKAGWLYQLYQPTRPAWVTKAEKEAGIEQKGPLDATRPAGQWNQIYFRQTPQQSEVMMNGVSYYRFTKGSEDWDKRVAASKFAQFELFGKPTKGHICLQDHNDLVAFRNVKIRMLPEDGSVTDPVHGTLPVQAVEAFPGLEWDQWEPVDDAGRVTPMRPIVMTHANDGSGRIFVATQAGQIHVLPEGPESKKSVLFADFTSKVAPYKKANEEGFLGLAFHPEYASNGRFYVYYTSIADPHLSVVSQLQVSKSNPNQADLQSEKVLWTLQQPFGNHNGGTIAFGPDGYLYIGLGDGGSADDPFDNGQNLETALGSLLRIDVNSTTGNKPYGIPADNPFVKHEKALPEIFAYGFRNIWRLSFDRLTGDLWVADVGQNLWEEINVVQPGKNYGWNRYEGSQPFGNRPLEDAADAVPPVWEYDHGTGKSITGGFVYRGKQVPALEGKYLYADFVTGKLWALDYDVKAGKVNKNWEIPSDKLPVLTFGEDQEGEIYFSVETASGRGIYRFASN